MSPEAILRCARIILVIDWPSKDVPESLARAGLQVVVQGGPGPEDYSAYEESNGQIVVRKTGRAPERADLVYSYRPLKELPQIAAKAKNIGARAIWTQTGTSAAGIDDPKGCWLPEDELRTAREIVQAAGLDHISAPYIGDVARQLQRI